MLCEFKKNPLKLGSLDKEKASHKLAFSVGVAGLLFCIQS